MYKTLSLLFLLISFSSYSQKRLYQCDCEENQFRQTFEIDILNQTIQRYSSLNLEDGMYYDGEEYPYNDLVWTPHGTYLLNYQPDYLESIYFYKWDFETNEFFSQIYDSDGPFFQDYKCVWIKRRYR